MSKSKQTKNKHLRQLVRNYEIELQRPKGVKLLDNLIKNISHLKDIDLSLFVSSKFKNEMMNIKRYKGYNIFYIPTTNWVIACDENNLYPPFKEIE